MRESGVLLHISSLPNPYGIGTFGRSAYDFVDFLRKANQRYWQILPLSPTGFGDSPYQSCSAFAGNPYFIDLDLLCKDGLLQPCDYQAVDFGQNLDGVDYGQLYKTRFGVLRKAYRSAKQTLQKELAAFAQDNGHWLPDYALFMAAKTHFGMAGLQDWPDRALAKGGVRAKSAFAKEWGDECNFHVFLQYCVYKQWAALKAYANQNNVRIIGDIPIYVSGDSADVWGNPELFLLDGDRRPTAVAGVPPDYFSETGQLWGNPLYNWKKMESDGFSWWIRRIEHMLTIYDVLRIDHFRGLEAYWAVDADAKTAAGGRWRKGPGMKWYRAVRDALPDANIVVEDLGVATPALAAFLHQTGLAGMRMLVFAFNPCDDGLHLPHNYIENTVAFTSNHDSTTFAGWLADEATPEEARFAAEYLRLRDDEGPGWGAVKAVWASTARLAMAPFQDILNLGGDARINTPSTLGGRNWCWRVRAEAFNDGLAQSLRAVTHTYRRNCK